MTQKYKGSMVNVDLTVFRYLHLQVTLQVEQRRGSIHEVTHLCKTSYSVHIKARYINKKRVQIAVQFSTLFRLNDDSCFLTLLVILLNNRSAYQ